MPSSRKAQCQHRDDLEAVNERYLTRRVKEHHGLCIKLNAGIYTGIPDRIVVLPGGRVAFVELKRIAGGRLSVAQKMWMKWLTGLGMPYYVLRSKLEIEHLIEEMTK